VVLLGATGYTGRLVTSSLVEIGETPLIAGRDRAKLTALSEAHGGLEVAVADVGDEKSVRRLVGAGDILVSTVGPFTLLGKPALEAALAAGAHYLDSTGEPGFIRTVFKDAGPLAVRSGTTLMTAFGVDWVPGNVAGAHAIERARGEARRLDVGYLISSSGRSGAGGGRPRREPLISTGTRASILAASAAPQHSYRAGRLVLEPAGRATHAFRSSGVLKWGISVGASEALTLPKLYPELEDVSVYLESPGPHRLVQPAVLGFSTVIGAISRTGPGRRAVEGAVRSAARKTGGGPSEGARSKSGTEVIAICRDKDGTWVSATRLSGATNGYTLTGKLLAWGAAAVRAGAQKASGAVGAVEAFGLDECLAALSSAGLEALDLAAD
jgi:short subunit dehydrogenase-like uncharacterized protein